LFLLKTAALSQCLPFPFNVAKLTEQLSILNDFVDSIIDDASNPLLANLEVWLKSEGSTHRSAPSDQIRRLVSTASGRIAAKIDEHGDRSQLTKIICASTRDEEGE
jgi:hypothetical protein